MSRFIAVFTKAGNRYGHGPYASRIAAATDGALAKSLDFDLRVEVVPLADRPLELGHVPMGIDASGNGPVPDREAVRYECLECGCPAIAHPTAADGYPIDRLAEHLRHAQSELLQLRKQLRTD